MHLKFGGWYGSDQIVVAQYFHMAGLNTHARFGVNLVTGKMARFNGWLIPGGKRAIVPAKETQAGDFQERQDEKDSSGARIWTTDAPDLYVATLPANPADYRFAAVPKKRIVYQGKPLHVFLNDDFAIGADTALSRIVDLVKNAQASRAPAQQLADTAGKWLTFIALGAGLSAFLFWYFFGPMFGVSEASRLLFAITAAVSTIVIACPDALALATPTAITVGVGKGAEGGVLFKNASALEATAGINTVIFDKTGTLTEGKPALTDLASAPGMAEDETLRLAASADQPSQHPLAEAIVRAAQERKLTLTPPEKFDSVPGKGVVASVGGRRVLIGNLKLMESEAIALGDLDKAAEKFRTEGKTAMFVAVDGKAAGVVAEVTVPGVCCHTFRATGITAYLMNGGTVENAQMIAAHESPRTTKLYDRRSDDISLDEVEKIVL